MKAAREEVQKLLEGSGLTANLSNPSLNLTREQLDSMPVMGKIISR